MDEVLRTCDNLGKTARVDRLPNESKNHRDNFVNACVALSKSLRFKEQAMAIIEQNRKPEEPSLKNSTIVRLQPPVDDFQGMMGTGASFPLSSLKRPF